VDAPPLLITGMHRSGTSATARLLHRAGLDLGRDLMRPSLDNPLGYYEDLEFYELNRELLAAGLRDEPECRPDWAFPERVVSGRLVPLRPRAKALIATRRRTRKAWGFKDPRTAVLLDFYDEIVPDARYLFVYRAPWEVVESLLTIRDHPLRGRANDAVAAWISYNERLLEFRRRHPERATLVHVDAVARCPQKVVSLAQKQLDDFAPAQLDTDGAHEAFVGTLLRRRPADSPFAQLMAADHPEAIALYAQLEASADIAGLNGSQVEHRPAVELAPGSGRLPLAAAVVGEDGDVPGAATIARPSSAAAPASAADACVERLADGLVAVVFDSPPREESLEVAVAALQGDPGLGAVLLTAGAVVRPPVEHEPGVWVDPGAAVVLRHEAWLATRGFAEADPPAGHEAVSFTLGCLARGIRAVRISGALPTEISPYDRDAVAAVLERHPAVAARCAADAEADRARLASELEQLRSTRSWRAVTRWWRMKGRFRRRPRRAAGDSADHRESEGDLRSGDLLREPIAKRDAQSVAEI
jgi:hypothetical protein